MDSVTDVLELAPHGTRTKIRDAARELLARDGLSAFSMEAVAKRSGLSRRTVYNQFESRDALYRIVIQQMLDEVDQEFDVELPQTLPPAAAIRRFCTVVQSAMTNDCYRELIVTIDRDGRGAPWIERTLKRRVFDPLHARIRVYLLSKIVTGELEVRDFEGFCSRLFATLEASAGGKRGVASTPFSIDEVVEVVVRRLSGSVSDGLAVPSGALERQAR